MRPRRLRFPALRAAVASAAALVAIGGATSAHAQIVPPTASVPACHTFDAFGQPATLFAPGDRIIVKGEGFGLVTQIGVTFVQQSKTTPLGQTYSSELGVFSMDTGNAQIPTTATPGAASVHTFNSSRVATCAIQVMAGAAAAGKKSGSPGFVAWWGVLLLAFGVFLAVVGVRRWRAGRLATAVGQTPPDVAEVRHLSAADVANATRVHERFDLPDLGPLDEIHTPLDEPVQVEPPTHVGEFEPAEERGHGPQSLAELAAPPPEPDDGPEHSAQRLAELAAPPPEVPEADAEEVVPAEPAERTWPARRTVRRDEILAPGVYWPTEELADADEDAFAMERDHAPERGTYESPVDVADASEVADAMAVPMPDADHTHPPILDAGPGDEWPEWNRREPQGAGESAADDDEKDPVVEGDMSDTVARLVEDTKGWNKP